MYFPHTTISSPVRGTKEPSRGFGAVAQPARNSAMVDEVRTRRRSVRLQRINWYYVIGIWEGNPAWVKPSKSFEAAQFPGFLLHFRRCPKRNSSAARWVVSA